MIELDYLDEQINRYYDKEMNTSELISFEARMLTTSGIKSYTDEKCYENYKISNSIKMSKYRAQKYAHNIVDEFQKKLRKKRLFF